MDELTPEYLATLTPEQQATLKSWAAAGCAQPGDLLPNPRNAHSYLLCEGDGTVVEMPCSPSTVFNPTISDCDFPENVSVDENPAPR